MIDLVFLVKFTVVAVFVLVLSIISERRGPKMAGFISGLPTGSVITLFFFGMENGAEFASNSAIFNLAGMVALQTLIFLYYLVSNHVRRLTIIVSSVVGATGYLAAISILQLFKFDVVTAPIFTMASIPLFIYLFRKIQNKGIAKRVKLGPKILLLRAVIASIFILAVTAAAHILGPKLAGLFSAFPTTLFPLMLIVHYTYGTKEVHTIIKNVPNGLMAMVIYGISVFFTYPLLGIYLGTLVSYSLVLVYVSFYFLLVSKD